MRLAAPVCALMTNPLLRPLAVRACARLAEQGSVQSAAPACALMMNPLPRPLAVRACAAIGGTRLRAIGGTRLRADDESATQAIGGTRLRAIGGTRLRAIGGTRLRADDESATQAIGGTRLRAIGGTRLRAENSSDTQAIGGTRLRAIGGTRLRNDAAASIEGYDASFVLGPVTAVNTAEGTATVLNRTIRIANSIDGQQLPQIGEMATISDCSDNPENLALVTYGEYFVPGVSGVVVSGVVTETDASTASFVIGDYRIDYSQLLVDAPDGITVPAGSFVVVKGLLY